MRGDRKAHRAHQMRRDPQPDVALGKRGAYPQKGPALQQGGIAMDQPRRGRGCARAEVALFQQDHPQAASRGGARNADAVQPAAEDRKIVVRHAATIAFSSEVGTGSHEENASSKNMELGSELML